MSSCETSQIKYIGDGTTTIYTFPFEYMKKSDIEVLILNQVTNVYENIPKTDPTYGWQLANATTIQFNTAPPSGTNLVIARNTDVNELSAEFFPGSAIRAKDLNANFEQLQFAVEEDRCNMSNVGVGSSGTVAVGTTTTGEPGTDALVSNAGEPTAAILDFTIPRGDVGPQGPAGLGVTFKGGIDATTESAPLNPSDGDLWYNTVSGTVTSGWGSITGEPIHINDRLIYNGTEWVILPTTAEELWEESNDVLSPVNTSSKVTSVETSSSDPSNTLVTKSYVDSIPAGGVTKIVAGNNVTISPSSGTGIVTVNSTGSGGGEGGTTDIYGTAKAWGTISAEGALVSGLNIANASSGGGVGTSYTVVFSTPMPDANYSVVLACENDSSAKIATLYTTDVPGNTAFQKTANGFSYYTQDAGGANAQATVSFAVYDQEPVVVSGGGGGGGGGGGSTTPVPQKVAYLRDEKPSGTGGGSSVIGWQDRTLNTKDDANNLVVLSNDKEFKLSAGEYQIEWGASAFYVDRHQTKLTNVTDGTTQEMGSSEYCQANYGAATSSFGSTRVKITSDTTYKIEHYCTDAYATFGLGFAASTGEPEVYTEVIVTDLAIVGGTGTAANTNIFGTAKAYSHIVSSEITGTTAAPSMAGVYESKGIVGIGKISTGQFFVDFETGLFKDDNYIFNGTATYSDAARGYIVYEDQRLGVRTATRVYIATISSSYVDAAAFDITVHDNTPAEIALTTFGDVINYSGLSAWANVAPDGTLEGGLNVASVVKTGAGLSARYAVTFQTPMPDANYSVTGTCLTNGVQTGVWIVVEEQSATGFTYFQTNYTGVVDGNNTMLQVAATNALPPKGGTGTDAWAACAAGGAIEASFNIASVTEVSAGQYDVVFTTPMPTPNYSVVGAAGYPGATGAACNIVGEKKADGFRLQTTSTANAPASVYTFNFAVNCTNATLPLTVTTEQIESAINNPGCAAWGYVAADGTLLGGLNASVSGNSPYVVTFQTPMPDANYSIVFGGEGFPAYVTGTKTANGFQFFAYNSGGTGATTYESSFAVFATNALPLTGGTGTDSWGSVQADGTIDASFNVASVTQVSTGIFDVVFTAPLPTANYAVTGSISDGATYFATIFTTKDQTSTGFTAVVTSAGVGQSASFSFTVNATNATLPSTFTEEEIQAVVDLAKSGGGNGASAWGKFDADGNLEGGFNCSINKVTTGTYDVIFQTPMPDVGYSIVTSTEGASGLGQRGTAYEQESTTGFRLLTTNQNSGAILDVAGTSFAVFASNVSLPLTVTQAEIDTFKSTAADLQTAETRIETLEDSIPDVSGFINSSYLEQRIGSITVPQLPADLITASELETRIAGIPYPNLTPYALKTELPVVPPSPDLSPYALKTELPVVPPSPDLTPYATTTYVETRIAGLPVPTVTQQDISLAATTVDAKFDMLRSAIQESTDFSTLKARLLAVLQ